MVLVFDKDGKQKCREIKMHIDNDVPTKTTLFSIMPLDLKYDVIEIIRDGSKQLSIFRTFMPLLGRLEEEKKGQQEEDEDEEEEKNEGDRKIKYKLEFFDFSLPFIREEHIPEEYAPRPGADI